MGNTDPGLEMSNDMIRMFKNKKPYKIRRRSGLRLMDCDRVSCQGRAVTPVTWRRWGTSRQWMEMRAACASTWSGGRSETTAVWMTSGRSTTRRWTRTHSMKANKGQEASNIKLYLSISIASLNKHLIMIYCPRWTVKHFASSCHSWTKVQM